MGCDIHLFVERREDDQWVSADTWEPIPETEQEYEDGRVRRRTKVFYGERRYDLFAILADVRNGRGFAGRDFGYRLRPIAKPRGLPDDTSQEVRDEADRWGDDGHSHSWLTLAELLAFDWDQTVTQRGAASAVGLRNALTQDGTTIVTAVLEEDALDPEYIDYIKRRKDIPEETKAELLGPQYYVIWRRAYRILAGSFYTETIPALLQIGVPEDVRIVFWFDN